MFPLLFQCSHWFFFCFTISTGAFTKLTETRLLIFCPLNSLVPQTGQGWIHMSDLNSGMVCYRIIIPIFYNTIDAMEWRPIQPYYCTASSESICVITKTWTFSPTFWYLLNNIANLNWHFYWTHVLSLSDIFSLNPKTKGCFFPTKPPLSYCSSNGGK